MHILAEKITFLPQENGHVLHKISTVLPEKHQNGFKKW